MKSVIITVVVTSLLAIQVHGDCDAPPPTACEYGMFQETTCSCQCIPPFCPVDGQCMTTTSCEDPWVNCQLGVNCPWWRNYMTTDKCVTGPKVPDGLWEVYSSEEECCTANFPTSSTCYIEMAPASPTKYPTISLEDEDGQEIVPIQFVANGISDNASHNEIKSEMVSSLRRILLQLSEDIEELKVTNVQERALSARRRRNLLKKHRSLEKNYEIVFDVFVVRNDEVNFAPIIIEALQSSYEEIISQIHSYSDIKYLGGSTFINFCALGTGGYTNCATEPPGPAPAPAPAPASGSLPTIVYVDPAVEEGLAGWAVALIVIFVLTIVFCAGYWVGVVFFGVTNCFHKCFNDRSNNNKKGKDFQNNMYLDDALSKYSHDARSRATYNSRQLMLTEQPHSQMGNDDVFTINTYRGKVSRDPTMYIPGQEGKPDPDPYILKLTNGEEYSQNSHRYSNRSSMKPKREPTMYVDGMPIDQKVQRDPTMYVGEDQPNYPGSIYEEEDYVNEDEDYNRSEQSVTRKHSVFMDEASIQVGDQSIASKSARSRKSRTTSAKKASSNNTKEKPVQRMKSGDSHEMYPSYPHLNYQEGQDEKRMGRDPSMQQTNEAASLFDLNASTPNINDSAVSGKGHTRQTQSFYK